MDKKYEYERLSLLEQETTKLRLSTFTALLSISFLLPGLSLRTDGLKVSLGILGLAIEQLVFLLGFLFFCFAMFHYHWYHRIAHRYRRALKDLEAELGIEVYRLRKRPKLGPLTFHFEWALHILGVIYGIITAVYVGLLPFCLAVVGVVAAYLATMFLCRRRPDEPLE